MAVDPNARIERPTVRLPAGERLDVALLLEGTYPFVSGGVSSWVHQIITGLPEIRFGLVFIGGEPRHYPKAKYQLPPNVGHLEEHYLAETAVRTQPKTRPGDRAFQAVASQAHDYFRKPEGPFPPDVLARLTTRLAKDPDTVLKDFLYSELAWEEITSRYRANCSDLSFIDYFWTVRSVHAPLFMLARAARGAPPARAYHTISTGFAGFLGALLGSAQKRPLVLTEHGIYTKERRIELLQATWLKEAAADNPGGAVTAQVGYIRRLWIRFFEGMGRLTYAVADPIVSLYEGNRRRQIQDGATEERTRVVPNGIDLKRFTPLRDKRPAGVPKVVGLLGRVVPIKDIKTFVRMMRVLANEVPGIEGWVIGPEDEDKGYAAECHSLVANLGLGDVVKFLGFQKPDDILPKLGLMILTSISEAQPLSLLEGFASGVPCVSTDVGCCRDLVYGYTPEDKALGASGRVVPIASPGAAAAAVKELLSDEGTWRSAQRAGIERVERFYTMKTMIDTYRTLYRDAMAR